MLARADLRVGGDIKLGVVFFALRFAEIKCGDFAPNLVGLISERRLGDEPLVYEPSERGRVECAPLLVADRVLVEEDEMRPKS